MSLMHYTPFAYASPMLSYAMRRLPRLLQQDLQPFLSATMAGLADDWVWEDPRYVMEVPMPGLAKKDVQVNVGEDGTLTIEGAASKRRGASAVHIHTLLPTDADTDTVHAALEDGLLTVTVAKKPVPTVQRRAIPIGDSRAAAA